MVAARHCEAAKEEVVEQVPSAVLIAEENEAIRIALCVDLRKEGYYVVEVEDGLELEDYLEGALAHRWPAPKVIIAAAELSGRSGLDVLRTLRERELQVPFILLTSTGENTVYDEAKALGAEFVLELPLEGDELTNAVYLAERRAGRRIGEPHLTLVHSS